MTPFNVIKIIFLSTGTIVLALVFALVQAYLYYRDYSEVRDELTEDEKADFANLWVRERANVQTIGEFLSQFWVVHLALSFGAWFYIIRLIFF